MSTAKSYYEILGIKGDCSEAEIRRAYRKAVREFHPDLNPDKANSNNRTRQLNIALEVLTSPEKRKRYDEQLKRKGRVEANKAFEKEIPKDGQEAGFAPDIDPAGFANSAGGSATSTKDKNRKNRRGISRSLNPVIMSLFVITAGASALCVVVLGLWVFLGSDSTGLIGLGSTRNVEVESAGLDKPQIEEMVSVKNRLTRLEDLFARLQNELAVQREGSDNSSRSDGQSTELTRLTQELETLRQNIVALEEQTQFSGANADWLTTKADVESLKLAITDMKAGPENGELEVNARGRENGSDLAKKKYPEIQLRPEDGFEKIRSYTLSNGTTIEEWNRKLSIEKRYYGIIHSELGEAVVQGSGSTEEGWFKMAILPDGIYQLHGGGRKNGNAVVIFHIRRYPNRED